jgi:hypothetical protein
MSTTNERRESGAGCARSAVLFALAALALAGGFALYARRPIWLTPPYHAYSPALYLSLVLLWLPLCALGTWWLPKRRLLAGLLAILLIFPACVVSLILAPQAYDELLYLRGQDYGSLQHGSLQEQHCVLEGRDFTCELAVGSSDTEMATYYTYRFQVLRTLPVMRLASFSSRRGCNPGYVTCTE